MKVFIVYLLVLFSFNIGLAQNSLEVKPKYPELFKSVVGYNEDSPQWVKLMYSDSPNVYAIESAYKAYFNTHTFVKTLHTQNYKHLMGMVYLNNYVKEDGSIEIPESDYSLKASVLEKNNLQQNTNPNNWTFIGPFETYTSNGSKKRSYQSNIYTIDQSLSNPNVLIAGTETGAVFISVDKGENWTITADALALGNRSIGAVAIDPSNENIMYIGASGSLYKTTDKGVTWSQSYYQYRLNVTDISINPTDSNEVIFTSGKGVYQTKNGGGAWSIILPKSSWDIERKTDDPKTIFVAALNETNNVSEIYKSTDVTKVTPVFVSKTMGYFSPTNAKAFSAGGARIGVTDADPNRVYVLLLGDDLSANSDTGFLGIYKSTDAAESWTLPYDGNGDGVADNDPGGPYSQTDWCLSCFGNGNTLYGGSTYNQGFYNAALAVSDTDADAYMVGMLSMFRTEDGGKTFIPWGGYICTGCDISIQHPDIQEIEINGNDIWVASDGGLDFYSGTDFSWQSTKNKGMNASEFWGFGQGWQEDVITGGRYHNGNAVYRPSYADGNFKYVGGVETGTGYINQAQSSIASFSDQPDVIVSQNLVEATKNALVNASKYPGETSYNTTLKGEIVQDPRWGNVNYLSQSNKLWKTEDNGANYNLITEFTDGGVHTLTDIEIPRSNPDYIYVTAVVANGPDSISKVYKTTDGGATWTNLSLPSSHHSVEIQVATDNENELYISFGHAGANSDKVFKTLNGGTTWVNITTSSLEEAVTHLIIQDGTDGGLYAATTKNVYYRNNTSVNWESYGNGLPTRKSFNKLVPLYRDSKLRAATYNRGIIETPLKEKSKPIAQPLTMQRYIDCSRGPIQFEDFSILEYAGATWQWSFPGAATVSSTTVRNPKVTYNTPGDYSVTLTVTDANGNTDTKTVANMVTFQGDLCKNISTTPRNALKTTKGGTHFLYNDDLDIDNVNNLTISGWIKPTGSQSNFAAIYSAKTSTGSNIALNTTGAGELRIHWNGAQSGVATNLVLKTDEWNYFAMVAKPDGVTLYLNEEQSTIPFTVPKVNIGKIYIGSHTGRWWRNFNGLIEEMKIWDRALTADEIRMERHIIETDISDSSLKAYWQFDEVVNVNTVYDKKGDTDLTISSNATLVPSSAPIGTGVVEKASLTTSGEFNFPVAGMKMNFSAGLLPQGDVYVTKLSVLPSGIPSTNIIEENYYIINNYGTNKIFDPISTITFTNVGNITRVPLSAQIGLFERGSSEFGNTWPTTTNILTSVPSSVGNLKGVTNTDLVFNNPGVTKFGQFFLGSSLALSVDEVNKSTIKVYPNPISVNQELRFSGVQGNFKFTLYDVSGRMIDRYIGSNSSYTVPLVPSGMYFYTIQTSNKIRSAKLIIE